MRRLLMTLLVFCPVMVWGQVCDFVESDTVYLIEARTSLRYRLGESDSTSTRWNNAILDLFINDTMREIAGKGVRIKVDTVATVVDTPAYTLSSDFIRVRPGQNGVMRYSTAEKRWKSLQYRALRTATGEDLSFGKDVKQSGPAFYYVAGKRIHFDPVPQSVENLKVFYQAAVYNVLDTVNTNYVGSVDSIIINVPVDCQELVVIGAMAKAFMSNKEDQSAMAMGEKFDAIYREKLASLDIPSEPKIKTGNR